MQHTLSGLFERYSDSRGSDALEDPGVDALLSGHQQSQSVALQPWRAR